MVSDGVKHNSAEMSFRIKEDGRFFSRLMAKESSNGNTSSRVFYYGETSVAAVPFMWEAQPGTPKHPLSDTSLPPLTPPPSYFSTNKSNGKRRNSKGNLLSSSFLPRFYGSKKSHVSPSSSSWSSSSSSTSSSSSWSLMAFSSTSLSMRDSKDQGQGQGQGSKSFSPSSPEGSPNPKCSNGFRGCYPFGNMIKNNATVSHGAL